MKISLLTTTGFRNLAQQQLEPSPRFTIISGNNGEGKSNLLEAIYVTSALRSFRTHNLNECVAIGAAQAHLDAEVFHDGLARRFEVILAGGKRRARIDDKEVRPLSRYFGGFNAVAFSPQDLLMPKATPAERRDMLDRAIFHAEPSYGQLLAAYDKTLRSRNAVLRAVHKGTTTQRVALPLLDVYDQQLAEHGARLRATRSRYVADIGPRFTETFAVIMQVVARATAQITTQRRGLAANAPNPADIAAQTQWLHAELGAGRAQDLARATTTTGPHRDDLRFDFGDRLAAEVASQGQLRTMALAWKISELEILRGRYGSPPVLLLDDVSSELDATRNRHLFNYLSNNSGQCLLTTTDAKLIHLDGPRLDVAMQAGRVSAGP